MASFRGWPVEAIEFFEGLEADNSKSYWTANKAVYENKVHAPMAALLADLAPDMGEGRIFRPYRDVRFSADKSGPKLVAIVAALRKKQIDVNAHETLKTAPRGYPKDHPRIDLLRQKGITAWKQWAVGAWLGTAAAKKRVVEFAANVVPLRGWLDSYVGDPA